MSAPLVAAIAFAACAAPPAPPVPPAPPIATSAPSPPPPDPCARAAADRARAPGLIDAGKLDRALRVLAHADALCPASTAASAAPRAAAEAALAAGGDDVDRLIAAGLEAKRAGNIPEAQRNFDRSAARLSRRDGAPPSIQIRNGIEASAGLPWKSNGGIFPRSLNVIVPDVAVSHDGKRVAIADGPLVLIADRRTKRLEYRFAGHTANITSLAWSPDDKRVASGAYDGTARVWDVASGASVLKIQPAEVVRAVRFLRDGAVIGCVHDDASAWDVATGKQVGRAAGSDSITEIDPDGAAIETFIGVPKARFDLFTGKPLPGPVPRVTAFTPDERTSVAAFADGLQIRRHPGGKATRTLRYKGAPSRIWITPDGRRFAVGEEDEDHGPIKRVRAFDAGGKALGTFAVPEDEGYTVNVVDISARGELTLERGRDLQVVDAKTGKVLRALPIDRLNAGVITGLGGADALTPDAIAFREDGGEVAVMMHQEVGEDWPSRLALIDLRARTIRDLDGGGPASGMWFSAGKLWSWSYNGVTSWDLAGGKPAVVLDGGKRGMGVEAVSGGRLALEKVKAESYALIDLSTGRDAPIERPDQAVFLGGSPDGSSLFFARRDKSLARLDTRSGKLSVIAGTASGSWSSAGTTGDGALALLVDRAGSAEALSVLRLAGGEPRAVPGAFESLEILGALGDHEVILHTRDDKGEATQVFDAARGAFDRRIQTELWEMGSIVPARGGAFFAASSRPEALFGFWSARGEAVAALRLLAGKKIAYLTTAEGLYEVIGDEEEVIRDHAYCLSGVRVYPAEVCAERWRTSGILRGIVNNEASYRDP